jgi:hypothetical protein
MDLILLRLTAPPAGCVGSNRQPLDPEIIADVIWTTAIPDDRLEHIRARPGPDSRSVDLVLFLRTIANRPGTEAALTMCRRAIDTAPALGGWTATAIGDQDVGATSSPWTSRQPRGNPQC